MKEIIVASTNQGKIKEIKAMLKDIDIEVLSMKDVLEQELEIEETGTTFKENALRGQKSLYRGKRDQPDGKRVRCSGASCV